MLSLSLFRKRPEDEKIDNDRRLEAATQIMRHSIPKWIDALLSAVGDETQRSGVGFLCETKNVEFSFFLISPRVASSTKVKDNPLL